MKRCWPILLLLSLFGGWARPEFPIPPGEWVESQQLVASDAQSNARFGTVSVSGDTAVIGAAEADNENGMDAGTAYVFARHNGRWEERTRLLASDGTTYDHFGSAVSLFENTAIVVAGDAGYYGAAYVFVDHDGAWIEEAKLTTSDPEPGDKLGLVSLEGDQALIGVPYDDNRNGKDAGAVYVFQRSNGEWAQLAKLTAEDGSASDLFGRSVALSGGVALIGAPSDDNENGQLAGTAYVFSSENGFWAEKAKLLPSNGRDGDQFGNAVSIFGDTALVGARYGDGVNRDTGSAYVFAESAGNWNEQAVLAAGDGARLDNFGSAVALVERTALIGAVGASPNGPFSGAAYIFKGAGGIWAEQTKLVPSDGAANDYFGGEVSLSGSTALIGANAHDVGRALNAGAAYSFETVGLAIVGSCPGPVTATISNAPPNSEVAVIAAGNNSGWVKGGGTCAGTALEIGEPFQLPPLFVQVDANGSGSGNMTLSSNRCWVEALALVSCETSGALQVP